MKEMLYRRKHSQNGSTNEEGGTMQINSFSDWQLIMKYWKYVFASFVPFMILVTLSANQNLIAWVHVEPILTSYAYSVHTLVAASITTWSHLELRQYVQRRWNHCKVCGQQHVLFLHLFWRRISGRRNSIQPINLSGMI